MTTSRQFADSEGDFKGWTPTGKHCGKVVPGENGQPASFCGKPVNQRVWESSCGGYEDYQYRCENGHVWWIDGIDS